MSLSGILKPNGYNLFCNSLTCNDIITGSGSIVVDDLQFKTLTQISGSGSAHIDALGHITTGSGNISLNPSGGTISSLGEISSTAGFFTPASLTAGIEVNTGVVNCIDVVASNDIISTGGSIETAGASMDNSGNIVGLSFSTSGVNINSSGDITVSGDILCATLTATGDIASIGGFIETGGASMDSAGNITASGDILCATLTANGDIASIGGFIETGGASMDSTGNITASGTILCTTLSANGNITGLSFQDVSGSFFINSSGTHLGNVRVDPTANGSGVATTLFPLFFNGSVMALPGATSLTWNNIVNTTFSYNGGASINVRLPNYNTSLVKTIVPYNSNSNTYFQFMVSVGGVVGSQVVIMNSSDSKFVIFPGSATVATMSSRMFRCYLNDINGSAATSFVAY